QNSPHTSSGAGSLNSGHQALAHSACHTAITITTVTSGGSSDFVSRFHSGGRVAAAGASSASRPALTAARSASGGLAGMGADHLAQLRVDLVDEVGTVLVRG